MESENGDAEDNDLDIQEEVVDQVTDQVEEEA